MIFEMTPTQGIGALQGRKTFEEESDYKPESEGDSKAGKDCHPTQW